MNEKKDNQMIIPPAKSNGTIMVPPKSEYSLTLVPQPLTNENLMNISGGDGEKQTPEIDPAGTARDENG